MKFYQVFGIYIQTSPIHDKKHDEEFFRWYQRPKQPWLNWKLTKESIEEIRKNQGHMEGFTMKNVDAYLNEKVQNNENTATWSAPKSQNFKSFLQGISRKEARYPDSKESQLISKTLDEVIMEVEKVLNGKAKIFDNCSLIRVGSSAEGLKTGYPDEFDYNIILPGLSDYVELKQYQNEEAITVVTNRIFFDIDNYNKSLQTIRYEMDIDKVLNENLSLIKAIVVTEPHEFKTISRLLRKYLDGNGDWKTIEVYDCLLYTSPSPRDGLLSRMPSSA